MIRKTLFALFPLLGIVLCTSCNPGQAPPSSQADMPNPASVYCEENGGRLELREDGSGSVAGVCIFSDGSECDEWAFFRGDCKPGDSPATSAATPIPGPNLPNPASAYCEQQGYRSKIVTAAGGSQSGVCVFPDGSECDDWAYYRGECGPATESRSSTDRGELP